MNIFDRNFNEILSSQIAAILGGLIVGTFLAVYTEKLLILPGMLMLIPGFLEMTGNINGSLASRISSGLYLGVIHPKKIKSQITKGNILAALFLAIIVSLFLGLIAFSFNYLLLNVIIPEIILLPLIAGVIANSIEIPLTLATTFFIFKKGYDPNNIMGPFITATSDITCVIGLLTAFIII